MASLHSLEGIRNELDDISQAISKAHLPSLSTSVYNESTPKRTRNRKTAGRIRFTPKRSVRTPLLTSTQRRPRLNSVSGTSKIQRTSSALYPDPIASTILPEMPLPYSPSIQFTSHIPFITPTSDFFSLKWKKKDFKLLIKKGKLVKNDAYDSLIQKYSVRLGLIREVVGRVEKYCKVHRIPVLKLDGKKVVQISSDELKTLNMTAILNCAIGDIKKLPIGPNAAAIKIQTEWRRYKATQIYRQIRVLWNMAKKIQIKVRSHLSKVRTRTIIHEEMSKRLKRCSLRKESLMNNWEFIKNNPRVEIHIAAKYPNEFASSFYCSQNDQVMRICRSIDPQTFVIYVSPIKLHYTEYYYAFLERCGVSDPRKRVIFITPEIQRRKGFFSTSLLLWISPKAILKIKELVGDMNGYIIPGNLSKNDIAIADLLDLPLYCSDYHTNCMGKQDYMQLYTRANISVPLSSEFINSLEEFYHVFSKLLVNDLDSNRWLLKMNTKKRSHGIAIIDVQDSYIIKRYKKTLEFNKEKARKSIEEDLRNRLNEYISFPHPSIWSNADEYFRTFVSESGFIQKGFSSPNTSGVLICLDLQPNSIPLFLGSANLLDSTDCLNVGLTYPQTSVSQEEILQISSKMSKVLYTSGIMGFVTLELLFVTEKKQEIKGIDIHLGMDYACSSIFMFHALCGGQLSLTSGSYLVEENQVEDIDECFVDEFTNILVPTAPSIQRYPNLPFPELNFPQKIQWQRYQERTYAYVYQSEHEEIRRMSLENFIGACRMKNLSFFMDTVTGNTFSLYGHFGIISVSDSRNESIKALNSVFNFILEVAGPPLSLTVHTRTEDYHLTDTIAKIKKQCIQFEKGYRHWRSIFRDF